MTYELINSMLKELGIRYTYYQFSEPVKDTEYIAYFESGRDNFAADNKVYSSDTHFTIELYTHKKDIALEKKLNDIFEKNNVFWTSGQQSYIDSEKMYLTIFYI